MILWNCTRVKCYVCERKRQDLINIPQSYDERRGNKLEIQSKVPKWTPPESSTSYTRFLFTAETQAQQKDKIIWFGFHYSFSLLNTSFSPLRSSEIRINTSSWIQMYAKDKLGLQGMMHLQRHVPQEYESQHLLLICISWAQEPNPHYILAEPRENKGKPQGISWSHWKNFDNFETRKHYSKDAIWGLCSQKQTTWFLCQKRRLPHHLLLQDMFLA